MKTEQNNEKNTNNKKKDFFEIVGNIFNPNNNK